jgi:predicted dinucleotide-binding enzyme
MDRVGIIGSGVVGQTLARGFKRHGHGVRVGSRTPAKLSSFAREHEIAVATVADVAAWSDALVLAVLGRGASEALEQAGRPNLSGKLVIDTTNPLSDEPPDGGVLRVFTKPNTSLMEQLQGEFPEARFVKAFNSVGHALMINPSLPGGTPTMFYCGDDERAKEDVATIIREFGWEPADMGPAAAARAIEPLCVLWCIPGFRDNSWTHAFKLLRP